MEVKYDVVPNKAPLTFEDLDVGDIFMSPEKPFGNVYVKINTICVKTDPDNPYTCLKNSMLISSEGYCEIQGEKFPLEYIDLPRRVSKLIGTFVVHRVISEKEVIIKNKELKL